MLIFPGKTPRTLQSSTEPTDLIIPGPVGQEKVTQTSMFPLVSCWKTCISAPGQRFPGHRAVTESGGKSPKSIRKLPWWRPEAPSSLKMCSPGMLLLPEQLRKDLCASLASPRNSFGLKFSDLKEGKFNTHGIPGSGDRCLGITIPRVPTLPGTTGNGLKHAPRDRFPRFPRTRFPLHGGIYPNLSHSSPWESPSSHGRNRSRPLF